MLQILDKPPTWMIFVPIFFVFFVQKMNPYKSGLAEFVENYLKSRRHALEAALEAEETGEPANLDALQDKVGNIPDKTRPPESRTGVLEHLFHLGEEIRAVESRSVRFLELIQTAEKRFPAFDLPDLGLVAKNLEPSAPRTLGHVDLEAAP
jgi:hypothetical protein